MKMSLFLCACSPYSLIPSLICSLTLIMVDIMFLSRYSYFHKLLPLLMTGLSDELPDIQRQARKLMDQVKYLEGCIIYISFTFNKFSVSEILKLLILWTEPESVTIRWQAFEAALGCGSTVYNNNYQFYPLL